MITLSKDPFENFLNQQRADQDPGYREVWVQLALGRLNELWKPDGITIATFQPEDGTAPPGELGVRLEVENSSLSVEFQPEDGYVQTERGIPA